MVNCACAGSEFAIVLLALHVVGQMVCTCMRYKIMTLVLYPPLRGATALNIASSLGPIFILKLAGTKNRAWYPLSRSWCACASHSPESGDSYTVVIWFVILSVK